MAVTQSELDQFYRFAMDKIADGSEAESLQELLDLWQRENPSPDQLHDDALAVKAALRDLDNGDRGIAYEDHLRELKSRYAVDELE